MEGYILNILIPYVEKQRENVKLSSTHTTLANFGKFRGECTEKILSILHSKSIRIVVVPANCTDCSQPMDLSVNKPAKHCLKRQFQSWYSDQVCKKLRDNQPFESIDLRMSVVKPLSARWMVGVYDYMKSNPDMIKNGFDKAGIDLNL
jgi:predicted Zn-ribbon and HTH transcriptional regulator